jgi:hypothetical protein
MLHVVSNIGGMNENFKTYDQSGPVYDFVSRERQRDAVLFFNKQLFATPFWLIDSRELSKFDNGIIINRIKSIQVNTLSILVSPPRLARMYDNETKNGSQGYSVAELFSDLRSGIFSADIPDAFQRYLQRAYIADLKNLLDEDFKSIPGLSVEQLANFGLTPINIALSDIRPMVRAELKLIDAHLPKGGDAITSAHYADLHLRIKEALNPNRPIVNLAGQPAGLGLTETFPAYKNMEPFSNCWPKLKWD